MQDNIDSLSSDYYQSAAYYTGTAVANNTIAFDGDITEAIPTGSSIAISAIAQQAISVLESFYTGFPPGETIVVLTTNSLTINSSVSVTQAYIATATLAGASSLYDPSLYVSSPAELTQSSVIPSTITTLKGQEGQSVYDLCMMTYGDIGQLYKLLQDSGIDSINETALSQQLFTYDTSLISDTTFYNYLISDGIIMNTGEGSLAGYNYLDQQNFYFILQENGYRITT